MIWLSGVALAPDQWDFTNTPPEKYPLLLHHHPLFIYRHKVIKQADVILLLCLLGDEYDDQTWRTNWETYVPITDHAYGSSLGPSVHAWAAAEMNLADEAYDYFMLAAKADIQKSRA